MEQTGHARVGHGVERWADAIGQAAVSATDATVREGFGVGPPVVHVLVDGLDPPYVGKLLCRPFYRGGDAHEAVVVMGLFGSMLGASRLLITYEHADMALAWEDPAADAAPTGVVVVDAALDPGGDPAGGHTIGWYPALFTEGPTVQGRQTMATRWGPPARYPGGRLPTAVEQLLAVWREPRPWADAAFLRVLAGWEQTGYLMRWISRPTGEQHQPRWMQLLAPIM
ncbi:MAG: hypothetical protein ACRDRK_26315 [Pseudonocardia sp.]